MLQISAFDNLGEEFRTYHLTYFIAIYQECSDEDHRLSCAFKNDEQPCFTDEDLFDDLVSEVGTQTCNFVSNPLKKDDVFLEEERECVELLSRNIALKMMLPSIMMLVSWFSITTFWSIKPNSHAISNTEVTTTQGDAEAEEIIEL